METTNFLKSKKADMAIGTLIIFIAMIVVAAIAAGVIIQTATALQNKALLTGEKAKQEIGTGITTILVYGEDGSDKTLESFFIKMKLSPGSDAMKFKDLLLEIDTPNSSVDSIYGERVMNLDRDPSLLDNYIVDLNDDDHDDYVFLENNNLVFNISNSSATERIYATVGLRVSADLSTASLASPVSVRNFNSVIINGSQRYGTVSAVGSTYTASTLDEEVLMIVGEGTAYEQGAFSVDYLMKSKNWQEGYLQRGDVIKMALVAPHEIEEDEDIDVRLVPKSGTPRTIAIVVPDLVNNKRVYMFS